MPAVWTPDTVLALAPDAASSAAGRKLATAAKWSGLHGDESALWGACQGSGAEPYRAGVDLDGPAFKCSCPSRKFPCKHGLALLLLYATQGELFTVGPRPEWLTKWVDGRATRAEKAEAKPEPKPVDDHARAKRQAARSEKMSAGVAELKLWLADLARRGLAAAAAEPYAFFDRPAKRMVDAQCPGLARELRALAGAVTGTGWQARVLDRLARLHLLVEAYARFDDLPPETRADVLQLVGVNVEAAAVLNEGEAVEDGWCVVGQSVEHEEALRVSRTWMLGRKSNRPALLLQFAHGTTAFENPLPPTCAFDGRLRFFPGTGPRALIETRGNLSALTTPPAYTLAELTDAYAAALARNPWQAELPATLAAVVPTRSKDAWHLHDAQGDTAVDLRATATVAWPLFATSGGRPVALAGTFDGAAFAPLAVAPPGESWQPLAA